METETIPLSTSKCPGKEISQYRTFDWQKDTCSFPNETVWRYDKDNLNSDLDQPELARHCKTGKYTHRCFVLSESAVQFFKFARFDDQLPEPDDNTLIHLIHQVRKIPAWKPIRPSQERLIIPGYPDLRTATAERETIFRNHLGTGWATYFRPGNHRIVAPVSRAGQLRVFRSIERSLLKGIPHGIWLINFPKLDINHATLAIALNRSVTNKAEWEIELYDPNFCQSTKTLFFNETQRIFRLQNTFYFIGGKVNVKSLYQRIYQ